jgi:hypothetical protein
VSERRYRMGIGVACNYWWQGQNAFSEKQIGELLRFVGQGTGADEWAGVCFRAEFKLKYFVFVDAVIFGGITFFGGAANYFRCGGDLHGFAGSVNGAGLLD